MDINDTADSILNEIAEEEKIVTTLRLNPGLYDRIRVEAAYERKSMAKWIREALELVVSHNEKKRNA